MTVEFSITMTLPSVANLREHWTAKATRVKRQRDVISSYWLRNVSAQQERGLDPPFLVTLTRQSPRRLDGDNLQSAFKAVRDEVARLLDIDDGDERVVFRYAQKKGPAAVIVKVQGA